MNKTTVLARELTKPGLEYHESYFNGHDEVGRRIKYVNELPKEAILTDPHTSRPLSFDLELPAKCPDSKFEMARVLVEAFGDRFDENLFNQPLWNWITLLWAKSVIGGDPAEKPRKLNEWAVYNLFPEDEAYGGAHGRVRQYRHRLWGPAFLYSRVGEVSRVCLTGDVSELSDVYDAVMTLNLLERGVIETIDAMYYDEEERKLTAKVKPGVRLRNELREGAIRECLTQISQIAATRAIHLLTPEQILDALPEAEFGRHVEVARVRLGLQGTSLAA